MEESHGSPAPPWWEPIWELVVHVLVGSILFAVIFTPAVALDLGMKWLKEDLKISEFLATLLTWTKYAVAVIDSVIYVVYLIPMGWLFVKKLWRTPHG